MKKTMLVALVVTLALLAASGCGSKVPLSVAGKTYLNTQEEADSRTIRFNPDGTFVYTITTMDSNTTNPGTYVVGDGKVNLQFGPGKITEFAGKAQEMKQDGTLLVDPDGSRWMVYSQP
ncbi:MAG: hypothetical protein ACYC99_09835 [Candidatus Geothermincolia bacterium]